MSFERLRELLALGPDGRNSDEEFEFERLIEQRKLEQLASVPRLGCCDAIQEYPVISFTARLGEDGKLTGSGDWTVRVSDKFWNEYNGGHYRDYVQGMPAVEYCPFCATPVPVMALKNPLPVTICRVTDGGYYCDNCNERLDTCLCDPPSSAFEPCIEEPLKTIPMARPLFAEDKKDES